MKVIVMRHGTAQGFATDFKGDAGRNLTDYGQEQAQLAGEIIAKNFSEIKVLSSVYNRAHQTAQQVAVACQTEVDLTKKLSPTGFDLAGIEVELEALAETNPQATVVLVSHIPIVSILADAFTNNRCSFHFQTASFVVIDFAEKRIVNDSVNLLQTHNNS